MHAQSPLEGGRVLAVYAHSCSKCLLEQVKLTKLANLALLKQLESTERRPHAGTQAAPPCTEDVLLERALAMQALQLSQQRGPAGPLQEGLRLGCGMAGHGRARCARCVVDPLCHALPWCCAIRVTMLKLGGIATGHSLSISSGPQNLLPPAAAAGCRRERAQGALLASDMAAFKAANPGAALEDFVRWHSPADWEGGRLSRRITAPVSGGQGSWLGAFGPAHPWALLGQPQS